LDSQSIASAEFVELNPLLDSEEQTVAATLALIGALFGETSSDECSCLAGSSENSARVM